MPATLYAFKFDLHVYMANVLCFSYPASVLLSTFQCYIYENIN